MLLRCPLLPARHAARTSGAGPRMTLPSLLYCEPWQGHLNLFSACAKAASDSSPAGCMHCAAPLALFQGTTQPRCVHTALRP